jgi:hypothetical protein
MPYIGNTPALDYISYAVQNFTVTAGTTSYTLDYSVANENDIRLVINNVIQRPGASFAYSATGTTLTLTSATLATDTMYAVFIGRAVQTVTPPASSITNTMLSPSVITGQTAETSIAGGDLVLIYDDSATALRKMTRTNFIAGGNTPAFNAYISAGSGTSMTANTVTKIICPTEVFDTASAYDTSTGLFTVPSGQAGKYFFGATLTMYTALSNITCFFYINGGATSVNKPKGAGIYNTAGSATTITYVADLAEGDTVGLYGFSVATNAAQGTSSSDNGTYFCGFKLI